MHVDRLFDVGLYLIEELARCPPSRSLGCVFVCWCVCRVGGEMNGAPLANVLSATVSVCGFGAAGNQTSGYGLYN